MVDRIYQKRTVDDEIDLENKEAAQNMQPSQDIMKMKKRRVLNEYSYPKIPADKREGIEAALQEIHQVITPTVQKLQSKANIAEIQERIYQKFGTYENLFNKCVWASKNTRDVNYCSDTLIGQLRGEGRDFVVSILKEYWFIHLVMRISIFNMDSLNLKR